MNMNKELLVSVIMPTYNREELVGRSIKSVLDQSYKNFEFIIINDCSTDNTEKIVEDYQKKDKRIKYLKNKDNLGIVKSLNNGLRIAQGEYIARVDDDDAWIDEKKLEKQIDFLNKHQEYVLIGTGSIAVFESKGLRIKNSKPEKDEDIRKKMLLNCPFLHPSVVFRKEAIDKIGFYDESLERAEDYDLWMRLGKIGKMFNLQEYSIESIVGASNVSHQKRREILVYNLKLIKKYKLDYPNYRRAYLKNYLEYLDATFPILRVLLRPLYWIRRFLLDRFSRQIKVEKL